MGCFENIAMGLLQYRYKKILVECHHGIGDLVMTFPAISKIREMNPDAEIHMLVRNEQQKELMLNIGLANKCYTYDVVTSGVKHLMYLVKAFRQEHYTLAYAFGQSPRGWDVLLLKMGGCKEVISVKHAHSLCGRYRAIDVSDCLHRVDQHLKCVGGGKYKKDSRDWMPLPLCVSQALQERIPLIHEKKIIGLCLGTGDFFYRRGLKKIFYNAKQWPIERFINLGSDLENRGYEIVYFGGNKEREYLINSRMHISGQCWDLIGKLSLVESVGMLKECDLVVGADTGLMHCAAAVGVRTLTIFGSTDERVIGPCSNLSYNLVNEECLCRPCFGRSDQKIRCCEDRVCLTDIAESSVCQKIINIIEGCHE